MGLETEIYAATDRTHRVFTPTDLGFNGVNWTRAGVFSFDIWVEGLKLLQGFAISQNTYFVDLYIYNEDSTATIVGPVQVTTGVGTSGGQIDHSTFRVGLGELASFGWFQRVRFRGRSLAAAPTPGSYLRVVGVP